MSILSKKSNSGISQKITALCYTYVCFQMVGYFIRKLRREQNLKVFGICFYLLSEIAWVRSVCLVYSFTLLTSLLLQISLMFNVDILLQEVSKPWVSSHLLTFTETFVAFFNPSLVKTFFHFKKKPLKVLKIIPDELHMNPCPLVNPLWTVNCLHQPTGSFWASG